MADPMRLTLAMLGSEGWRVFAPNGRYRECRHTASLPETVAKVVADYAQWLVETTSLDHLTITVGRKADG